MKKIPLNGKFGNGKFALIDNNEFGLLGSHSWYLHKGNTADYVETVKNGKTVRLHRLILNLTNPKLMVDHINHNGLDNRRKNLRIANCEQNSYNRNLTKGKLFKGIKFVKNRDTWMSEITFKKKRIDLGRFKNPQHAALVYDFWATYLFKDYARTNFKIIATG